MVTWKYTIRKINGKRRKVKVAKLKNGKVLVRVTGHRNKTDKGALPKRRKRRSKR
jgi:hypothetical protein